MKTPIQMLLSLLVGVSLLTSCGTNSQPSEEATSVHPSAESIRQLIDVQKETEQNAELLLAGSYIGKQTLAVDITMSNPDEKEISSLRSWLSFDPTKMKVVRIESDNSPFDLYMADENTFDNKRGIVSLGRSSQQPIREQEVHVARVLFSIPSVQTETMAPIDFYGYRSDNEGFTGVLYIKDGIVYNIMKQPNTPGLLVTILPPVAH